MSNYYNLDGIKTQLNKEIAENYALLEAWKNVTFPTKKDGTPFKVMSKNIDGAKYYQYEYAMQYGEYRLKVNAWCKESGYISSEIDVYCHVENLKDEKKEKVENYQPKQTYLKQIYTYDLEDIKEAVSEKIERLEKEIKQLEAQAGKAEKVYNNFKKAYADAMEKLKEESGEAENSTLFYMVKNTVTNRYPYC